MQAGNLQTNAEFFFVLSENILSLPFEGLCDCTQYDWDNGYLVTLFYGQIVPSQIIPLNSQHYSWPKKGLHGSNLTIKWDNLQAWNNLTMERSDCNLNVTVLY